MVSSKGCALRRYDVLDTGHEAGDQIQLALTNNRILGFEQSALGFIEAEKYFALRENRRLGRIDIFGCLFVTGQNPSAETNHPALLVADREHQTATKAVV